VECPWTRLVRGVEIDEVDAAIVVVYALHAVVQPRRHRLDGVAVVGADGAEFRVAAVPLRNRDSGEPKWVSDFEPVSTVVGGTDRRGVTGGGGRR